MNRKVFWGLFVFGIGFAMGYSFAGVDQKIRRAERDRETKLQYDMQRSAVESGSADWVIEGGKVVGVKERTWRATSN